MNKKYSNLFQIIILGIATFLIGFNIYTVHSIQRNSLLLKIYNDLSADNFNRLNNTIIFLEQFNNKKKQNPIILGYLTDFIKSNHLYTQESDNIIAKIHSSLINKTAILPIIQLSLQEYQNYQKKIDSMQKRKLEIIRKEKIQIKKSFIALLILMMLEYILIMKEL